MPMPFDTLAYAEQLKRAGFTDDQARALAELRLEVSEAKRDIETLKGGLPAKADDLHKLRLDLIPAQTFLGHWPWALGMIAMIAAFVALLVASIATPR